MNNTFKFNPYTITDEEIELINKNHENIILEAEDTKDLNSVALSKISNKVKIHIKGPLKGEKYNNIKYYNRNTYKIRELKEIIRTMESIEKNINPEWNEMQKAMYVYNTLASKMVYNFDYLSAHDEKDQSLHSLIKQSGVCAGFASVYYEMMQRQGIKCDYVRGRSGEERHAWNVLTIDDKTFGVDLTWESGKKQIYGEKDFHHFGNSEAFEYNHVPDKDEPKYNLELLDKSFIQENMDVVTGKARNYDRILRKDNSAFAISKLSEENVNNNTIYKYAQTELDYEGNGKKTNILYSETDFDTLDQKGKDYFYNSLLEKNRINKYLTSTNGYLGSIRKNAMGNYEKVISHGIAREIRDNAKSYDRDNNTNVVISKTNNSIKIKNINSYEATEYVNTDNGLILKSSTIYTKDNLLEKKYTKEKDFVTNELLSREHLDKSIENGGYIGNGTNIFGRYVKLPNKSTEKKINEMKSLEQQKMMAA